MKHADLGGEEFRALEAAVERDREWAKLRWRTALQFLAGVGVMVFGATVIGGSLFVTWGLVGELHAFKPKQQITEANFIDAGVLRFDNGARIDFGAGASDYVVFDSTKPLVVGELRHGETATVAEGSYCACFDVSRPGANCLTAVKGTTLKVSADRADALVRWVCWR